MEGEKGNLSFSRKNMEYLKKVFHSSDKLN